MKKKILKSSMKFLLRHKLQSFFMIFGIMTGIVFLCLTFSIGSGTEKQIMSKVKSFFGSDNIFILAGKGMKMAGPRSEGPITSLTIEDLEVILNVVPGVISYDPIQSLPECEVIYGNANISTTVHGRSVEGEVVWNRTVTSGEYFNETDVKDAARVALIGTKLAKQLFGEENPVGAQIRVGSVIFTVKGILEEKGTDPHGIDLDMEVVIPISTMMSRLMNVDYIAGAKLIVDETRMKEITNEITNTLIERHSVNTGETDDFSVITPVQVQEMTQKMKKIFSLYLPLISCVVLLLGGIIITILMLISVSRRIGEIGLRKAVGASSKDIMFQFLMESVLVSIIGGIIGLVLGIVGTCAFLSKMGYTISIPWQTFVFGVLTPILIGILAGIIPARKAARLNPTKALSL